MAHWNFRNGLSLSLGLVLTAWFHPAVAGTDPNTPKAISEHDLSIPTELPERIEVAAVSEIPEFKYSLLPPLHQQIEGNSYDTLKVFFDKDPNHPEKNPDRAFIRHQLRVSPKEMELEKVRGHLEAWGEKLEVLSRAALCKTVEWPAYWPPLEPEPEFNIVRVKPRTFTLESKSKMGDESNRFVPKAIIPVCEYPDLIEQLETAGQLIALKARYHILRGDYSEGCRWLRVGLSQARQMATNSNPLLSLVGMANATRMLQQIEVWIQQPGSPSLFRAIQDLPNPLVLIIPWDQPLESPDPNDSQSIHSIEPPATAHQEPLIMEQQLQRFVAILGCTEAIRLHAAVNEQQIPHTLFEIQEVRVPVDPVTGKSFDYKIDGQWVVLRPLDGPVPGRTEFRYQVIKKPAPPINMMGGYR